MGGVVGIGLGFYTRVQFYGKLQREQILFSSIFELKLYF